MPGRMPSASIITRTVVSNFFAKSSSRVASSVPTSSTNMSSLVNSKAFAATEEKFACDLALPTGLPVISRTSLSHSVSSSYPLTSSSLIATTLSSNPFAVAVTEACAAGVDAEADKRTGAAPAAAEAAAATAPPFSEYRMGAPSIMVRRDSPSCKCSKLALSRRSLSKRWPLSLSGARVSVPWNCSYSLMTMPLLIADTK